MLVSYIHNRYWVVFHRKKLEKIISYFTYDRAVDLWNENSELRTLPGLLNTFEIYMWYIFFNAVYVKSAGCNT